VTAVEHLVERLHRGDRVRLFLSGPMTSVPGWNYFAFQHAAGIWRARGFDVFNPADLFGGRTDRPRREYIRAGVLELVECDVLLQLPGWDASPGARLEYDFARELDLEITDA